MGIIEDLTGQRFGKWTMIERIVIPERRNQTYWVCRCDCGRMSTVIGTVVKMGKSTQCSKCGNTSAAKTKTKDLIGKSFGQLTVVEYGGVGGEGALWLCQCTCGQTLVTTGLILRQGRRTRCSRCSQERYGSNGPIYEARRQLGLTQKAMASRVGCDSGHLSDLERGRVKPRQYRIIKGLRKNVPAIRNETRLLVSFACPYCHRVKTMTKTNFNKALTASKSGLLFCDNRCASSYRYSGPLPIPSASTLSPEVVASVTPPPKVREKRKTWTGLEKTLREAKQRDRNRHE